MHLFLVDRTTDEAAQSGLPSFTGLHEERELWYQQRLPAPIRLLSKRRQIWVSLPYWLRFWVLFGSGASYPPPPSRKDTGGRDGGWNIWRIPTHGSKHWVGLSWKMLRNSHPVKRWWGAGWKMPGELTTQWKGTGLGGWIRKKNEEYPGRGWNTPRSLHWRELNGLDWVVKRLIWHFSPIWLPL